MKKKNKLRAVAFLLAATITMALAAPASAKAESLEAVLTKEKSIESNGYGGRASKTTIETKVSEAYNVENSDVQATAKQAHIFYVKNSHGDIIGKVDEYGNLLSSYAYNSFGELVSTIDFPSETAQSTNRFLYAGEQYDETSGLYYLRARCYDADAGRFTQEDTYLGDGRNLYAYTHSNPLKYVDPSGHMAETYLDDNGDTNDWIEKATLGGGGGQSTSSMDSLPTVGAGNVLRQTVDQKAVYDLAKAAVQSAKSGNYISASEAAILDSWAVEYNVPQHHQAYVGSGAHFPGGNYMDHTHIYGFHVAFMRN